MSLGSISAQSVAVSPTSLSFGNQVLGTMSSAKKVTLTNSQRTAITISISTNLADFKQSHNCPSTLSAGSSCAISVMFTPAALGFRIGTLNINDTGAGGPQTGVLS